MVEKISLAKTIGSGPAVITAPLATLLAASGESLETELKILTKDADAYNLVKPAIEKSGSISTRTGGPINFTNLKLASGLLGLGLAASCGDVINKHIFYGPNGEEIEYAAGNCEKILGKNLWYIGLCQYGSVTPVGEDCSIQLFNPDNPVGSVSPGVFNGNVLTMQVNPSLINQIEFRDADQVSRENIAPESEALIEKYLCMLREEPSLKAARNLRIQTKIDPSIESLFQFREEPFPGKRACVPMGGSRSPWFKACRIK